ncbi:MAG: acylneuraminate cytidylyltransferase family protein [Bacteroidota bacterium]
MLAIIPARGGSKGLPGKNIKNLLGKPLIAWTIEAALKSSSLSRLIISTDDPKIAEIAISYGADCPFMRPEELATDSAKAIDTYIYTLDRLMSESGIDIPNFMVLQPTSPLRTANDIDEAVELFKEKKADSVISYVEEAHPIGWHKYVNDEGKLEEVQIQNQLLNRQAHRKSYYPNGSIYVFSYELIKSGKYFSDNSYAYIMDRFRSVDVDVQDDFDYAEFLLMKKQKEQSI